MCPARGSGNAYSFGSRSGLLPAKRKLHAYSGLPESTVQASRPCTHLEDLLLHFLRTQVLLLDELQLALPLTLLRSSRCTRAQALSGSWAGEHMHCVRSCTLQPQLHGTAHPQRMHCVISCSLLPTSAQPTHAHLLAIVPHRPIPVPIAVPVPVPVSISPVVAAAPAH